MGVLIHELNERVTAIEENIEQFFLGKLEKAVPQLEKRLQAMVDDRMQSVEALIEMRIESRLAELTAPAVPVEVPVPSLSVPIPASEPEQIPPDTLEKKDPVST